MNESGRFLFSLIRNDFVLKKRIVVIVPVCFVFVRFARLIIRNVSFSCSEERLRDSFEEFGSLKEV